MSGETGPELDWRARAGQLWPFAGVVVVTFFLTLIPPHAPHAVALLLVSGLAFLAVAVLTVVVPWQRLPDGAALVVVVVFCVAVGLLRASAGGANAGYGPLLMLPVVWQALYGRRFELWATLFLVAATYVVPIIAIGDPDYPASQWRLALLSVLVFSAIGGLVQHLMSTAEQLAARLESMAWEDPLTGLPNRRAWDMALRGALQQQAGDRRTLSVALLDLDFFKAFNDAHGHVEADHMLECIGHEWSRLANDDTVLARWGGEEFAVLLTGNGLADAERAVGQFAIVTPGDLTFSAGLVEVGVGTDVDRIMAEADRLLYVAKSSGRACIAAGSLRPSQLSEADAEPSVLPLDFRRPFLASVVDRRGPLFTPPSPEGPDRSHSHRTVGGRLRYGSS